VHCHLAASGLNIEHTRPRDWVNSHCCKSSDHEVGSNTGTNPRLKATNFDASSNQSHVNALPFRLQPSQHSKQPTQLALRVSAGFLSVVFATGVVRRRPSFLARRVFARATVGDATVIVLDPKHVAKVSFAVMSSNWDSVHAEYVPLRDSIAVYTLSDSWTIPKLRSRSMLICI
jgi:hypothetical protein